MTERRGEHFHCTNSFIFSSYSITYEIVSNHDSSVLHRIQYSIGDLFRVMYFCSGSFTFFFEELGLLLDCLTLISSPVQLKIISKNKPFEVFAFYNAINSLGSASSF